jgi:hypothetical protein
MNAYAKANIYPLRITHHPSPITHHPKERILLTALSICG